MFLKKIILSILVLTLAAGVQAQKIKVQANIEGLSGPVIFNYMAGTIKKSDTVNVKNGKFTWKLKLSEPQKIILGFPNGKFPFYADKGKIRITGQVDSLQQLRISGSPLQKEADEYFASIKELTEQEAAIYPQLKEVSKDEQKTLNEKLAELKLQKKERLNQYIKAHPKSYVSLGLIADRIAISAKYEEVKQLYDMLHPAMQQTAAGKILGETLPEVKDKDAYHATINKLSDQKKSIQQQYSKASKEEQKVLEKKYEEIEKEEKEKLVQFIKAHSKSDISLSLVLNKVAWVDYAYFKSLYDLLDPSILQTESGKLLGERLAVKKRSAPGEPMLNFTLNSVDGKPIRFSDFKGQYVFVDFWASWCGPCRAENPNVLAAYNRFRDKNFTVIGVSFDNDEEKWKKAIREDKLPWTQVSDLKGFKNPISSYYAITGIPSTLLVGPDGNIIAKDLRGKALHEKLAELLDK